MGQEKWFDNQPLRGKTLGELLSYVEECFPLGGASMHEARVDNATVDAPICGPICLRLSITVVLRPGKPLDVEAVRAALPARGFRL